MEAAKKEGKMKESGLNAELFDAENSPAHVCHKLLAIFNLYFVSFDLFQGQIYLSIDLNC